MNPRSFGCCQKRKVILCKAEARNKKKEAGSLISLMSSWIKLNLKPMFALDFQLHAPLNYFYYLGQFELALLILSLFSCSPGSSSFPFLLHDTLPQRFIFVVIYKLDDLSYLYNFSLSLPSKSVTSEVQKGLSHSFLASLLCLANPSDSAQTSTFYHSLQSCSLSTFPTFVNNTTIPADQAKSWMSSSVLHTTPTSS